MENTQHLITKLGRDMSDAFVTPCGELQSPKITRTNTSTIGPILSVRPFEFETLHGLDILVLNTAVSNMTVLVTACLGKKHLQAKKNVSATKGDETIEVSSGTGQESKNGFGNRFLVQEI